MTRILYLFISFAFLTSFNSAANHLEDNSPYTTLEVVGQKLFSRIANNQEQLAKFPSLMETIVEEELMPYVDYQYSAFRILGKHLKKTSKAQRQQFSDSMRKYLIRTYATALKNYHDQEVVFESNKSVKGKRIVGVNAKITDPGKPNINIVFKMRQHKKTKQWKAFDMVVEGISLLNTKQAEINSQIAKLGVEQVALELAYVKR